MIRYPFRKLITSSRTGLTTYNIYSKLVAYPPAFLLAWGVLNFTGITANQITLLGFVLGCLGAALSFAWGLPALAVGYICFYILDFTDGIVARNGRGCGEKGVLYDIVAGRTVLCVTATTLAIHHTLQGCSAATAALLVYCLAYLYEDLISYAIRVAKNRYGQSFVEQPRTDGPLTVRDVFLKPALYLPDRLGSPLFVILVALLSRNMFAAYLVGALLVVSGYVARCRSALGRQFTGKPA